MNGGAATSDNGPSRLVALGSLTVAFGAKRKSNWQPVAAHRPTTNDSYVDFVATAVVHGRVADSLCLAPSRELTVRPEEGSTSLELKLARG